LCATTKRFSSFTAPKPKPPPHRFLVDQPDRLHPIQLPESVVTARPLIVRDEITMDALRKGRLFGASKSPAPVPSTTTGVRAPSTARSQPPSTARSQSQEARTAAAIGTPCGRTTGAPAQPEVATTAARTSSAERPADNTAILHGPSGLAIIAIPDTAGGIQVHLCDSTSGIYKDFFGTGGTANDDAIG
ncbi:hypothetical protein COOONC_22279, partial [Cooperia oncophora]